MLTTILYSHSTEMQVTKSYCSLDIDSYTIQVGWMGTAILMMKTQIGLGVLSIPLVFDTLGMIPGIIVLLCIAAITTWVCAQRIRQIVDVSLTLHPKVRLYRWCLQNQPS